MIPNHPVDRLRDFALAHTLIQTAKMVGDASRVASNLGEKSKQGVAEIVSLEFKKSTTDAQRAATELLTGLLGREPTDDEIAYVMLEDG